MTTSSPTAGLVQDADFVQLLFTDIAGRLKTLEIPSARWAEVRDGGWTLDGSVLLGYGDPEHSDLRLVPDPSTYVRRPWTTPSGRTVGMVFCDVLDTAGRPFAADPRAVLRRAVRASEARGQRPVFGVEAEFYLLRPGSPGTAGEPADGAGYWDLSADEEADEVCRDIAEALALMGLTVDGHHHEVCAGQRELVFRHGDALATADRLLLLKHTARVMARRRGLSAVFMPKPLAHLYGNALHVHVSLEGTGESSGALFHDGTDSDGMSALFRGSLAGVLDHAPALTALGNPTVNSYKRLVPASGTPVHRSWARHNRSTAFKVVGNNEVPRSVRLEMRSPDPSANPHLLFAGILAAFADGQDRDLKLPAACEEPADQLTPQDLATRGILPLPTDLPSALRALEEDTTVREALGDLAADALVRNSRADWAAWHRLVTPWEIERYADSV
ncbi:glutamine synthetase family protein [Streptomyces griseocarneus]|uniref:glutamine synthetase family protein n=1 Tax=Streptomyces griseocarneus TaxID=51201 RepID=UPI00167D4119|nr:glutamine synthetase family protein [Streptomyces griseocarneus]MBZ6477493.1 glutamine synthetase family protein [Streptomyces griseocarneus]GHG49311.1 glutamine synthetase [Streptomyces griseocarneus]